MIIAFCFIFLHFKILFGKTILLHKKLSILSQLTCPCNGKLPWMHRCTRSCSRNHLAKSDPECKFGPCRCSYLLKIKLKKPSTYYYSRAARHKMFVQTIKNCTFQIKIKQLKNFKQNIFWHVLEYPVTAPEVDPVATWGRPCPVKLPV